MTIDEATSLKKGDYITYRNLKYKVMNTKECRNAHTNEIFVNIKCRRKNQIIWLSNDFADKL